MKRILLKPRIVLVFIPLISLVMHYHVFTLDLIGYHVWHQTQTQTIINNYVNGDFNILHPKINNITNNGGDFRMEFPIMQWIFAGFIKIFGNGLMISRILSFIIGIFSVFGMYYLLKNIFKNKVIAAIGGWAFNFSPLFYYYSVNPMPDNLAQCCSIWSIAFFFKWKSDNKVKNIISSAIFLSIATLAKLPFILFGSIIFIFIIMDLKKNKFQTLSKNITLASIFLISIIPPFVWYITAIPTWKGNGVVKGILNSDKSPSEVLDMMQHIFISTLPELLINYGSLFFFISGFYFLFKNKIHKTKSFPIFLFLGITLLLYYFYEANMIGYVHDYYLFPFLPPIFLLVAYGAYQLYIFNNPFTKYIVISILLLLPLTAYLRADTRWNPKSPGFNVDLYNYKDELRNLVPSNSICIAGRDFSGVIYLYYIDKKGWTYDNPDELKKYIDSCINKGAKYIYMDNQVDTISGIKEHLQEKIFDKGSIRVYKLK